MSQSPIVSTKIEQKIVINKKGDIIYYDDKGKIHRDGGPAGIFANGNKLWSKHGKAHRLHKPALEWADGTLEWFVEGKRHCEEGPAFKYPDGREKWYIEGIEYSREKYQKAIFDYKNRM